MKINSAKLALACTVAISITWVICSLLVMLMPLGMMQMTGHMVHGDFSDLKWTMGMHGLLFGLVGWALVAGFTGWLISVLYNRFVS